MDTNREKILLVTQRETTVRQVHEQFQFGDTDDSTAAYQVIDLPDLPAALPGIKAREYQLALLDNGPGECFQQPLKDWHKLDAHLPVIVLADSFDEEMILLALSLGAQECVPLDGEKRQELTRAVRRALVRKRAEIAKKQSDSLLAEVINAIPHPLYIIDVEDNADANGNQVTRYQREKDQIKCYVLAHNQDVPCSGLQHDCPLHHVLVTGRPYATRQVQTDQNGQARVVEVYGYPILDEKGNVSQMVEYVLDITERLAAEVKTSIRAVEQTRLAAQVFDSTSEGIIITDPSGEIVSVNRAFSTITGYTTEEAIGKTPNLLKSGRHEDEFYARMWAALNDTGQWRGEIWNRRKDGDIYPEWLTISAVKNDQGEIINYMAIFIDISQRIKNEELLRYLATHDPLTKIPNRELFRNRLMRALARSQRSQQKVAILMLDLDGFKNVNDEYGHAAGDIVLQKWSDRLKGSVRENDTVARLGGDEFSIILEGITSEEDAMPVVNKILARNEIPYALNGHSAQLTASIGITLYPDDGKGYEELLHNADQAMYVAKANGKNCFAFYSRST